MKDSKIYYLILSLAFVQYFVTALVLYYLPELSIPYKAVIITTVTLILYTLLFILINLIKGFKRRNK